MDPRDYGEGKSPERETQDSMQMLAGGLLLMGIFFLIVFGAFAYHYWHHNGSCNHGESSISGHFAKNSQGKTIFITDQAAHRTGC